MSAAQTQQLKTPLKGDFPAFLFFSPSGLGVLKSKRSSSCRISSSSLTGVNASDLSLFVRIRGRVRAVPAEPGSCGSCDFSVLSQEARGLSEQTAQENYVNVTHTHTDTQHTCMHVHTTHRYMHAHTNTHVCTCTQQRDTCVPIHTAIQHTDTCMRIHTYNTQTHRYIHTHTHT